MILVTGHKGLVGSAVLAQLKSEGRQVIGLEKSDAYYDWCPELFARSEVCEITTIIHCGAISDNQYKALDIFDWNTYCVRVIADVCRRQGIHLIYLSSQTACNPTTLYGHSKKMAETIIGLTPDLDACIFRPFNIWGEGEYKKPPHCRSLVYRLADHELKVLWDTERDYIHVSDVLTALKTALQHRTCGTYELGTGTATPSVMLAQQVDYDGYTCEDRPLTIQAYACADPKRFLPDWNPLIKDVLSEMTTLEKRLGNAKPDPFDAVEISTKRAAENKERRFLTDAEMIEVECSAQQRNSE